MLGGFHAEFVCLTLAGVVFSSCAWGVMLSARYGDIRSVHAFGVCLGTVGIDVADVSIFQRHAE